MPTPNSAASTAADGRARPDQAAAARRHRLLGSLDAALVRRLRERIAEATSRLSWRQAGQLAQLAARTGIVFASRAALARMLGIGRRTLDRVLAELAGLVFVVAAVEGRQGGTALVPIWGHRDDAPPLDAEGCAAVLAGYLRRAGALNLSPAAVAAARSLRGVSALVICATGLPAKALRLLAFALAKLRQAWRRKSGLESQNPESSAAATPNRAATPSEVAAPTPASSPELEPAAPELPPTAQQAFQGELERASTALRTSRPRAEDVAAIRASAERLSILPASVPKPRPTASQPTNASRHRLLDTPFLRAHPLPDEASFNPSHAAPAPAAATREESEPRPLIPGGGTAPLQPFRKRPPLKAVGTWLRRFVPW